MAKIQIESLGILNDGNDYTFIPADGTVSTDKIVNGAITTSKLDSTIQTKLNNTFDPNTSYSWGGEQTFNKISVGSTSSFDDNATFSQNIDVQGDVTANELYGKTITANMIVSKSDGNSGVFTWNVDGGMGSKITLFNVNYTNNGSTAYTEKYLIAPRYANNINMIITNKSLSNDFSYDTSTNMLSLQYNPTVISTPSTLCNPSYSSAVGTEKTTYVALNGTFTTGQKLRLYFSNGQNDYFYINACVVEIILQQLTYGSYNSLRGCGKGFCEYYEILAQLNDSANTFTTTSHALRIDVTKIADYSGAPNPVSQLYLDKIEVLKF